VTRGGEPGAVHAGPKRGVGQVCLARREKILCATARTKERVKLGGQSGELINFLPIQNLEARKSMAATKKKSARDVRD